jgi:hypothetical protein
MTFVTRSYEFIDDLFIIGIFLSLMITAGIIFLLAKMKITDDWYFYFIEYLRIWSKSIIYILVAYFIFYQIGSMYGVENKFFRNGFSIKALKN